MFSAAPKLFSTSDTWFDEVPTIGYGIGIGWGAAGVENVSTSSPSARSAITAKSSSSAGSSVATKAASLACNEVAAAVGVLMVRLQEIARPVGLERRIG